jgi:hypothetical protein
LDVTFREDACRARTGNAPLNLSTLRKFALQLLSIQKDKLSLKKRQYKAALDIGYLKKNYKLLMRLPWVKRNQPVLFSRRNTLEYPYFLVS